MDQSPPVATGGLALGRHGSVRLRIKLIDLLVTLSIIAVICAIALPPDFWDRFDRNPDNTYPISQVLPAGLTSTAAGGPRIVLLDRRFDNTGDEQFEFVLLNSSESDIFYFGYTPTSFRPRMWEGKVSPLYKKEVRIGDTWEDQKQRWCGNGATQMRLKPGHAGRFTAWRHADQLMVRFGVYCSPVEEGQFTESTIVWSPVIESRPSDTP